MSSIEGFTQFPRHILRREMRAAGGELFPKSQNGDVYKRTFEISQAYPGSDEDR